MPNHTENRLEISGPADVIKEIACSHFTKNEEGSETLSCNSIIPMPISMNIESGGHVSIFSRLIQHYPELANDLEKDPTRIKEARLRLLVDSSIYSAELIDLLDRYADSDRLIESIGDGRKALHNIENYGHADWYNWKRQYWGTKWGAYDGSMTHDETTISAEFQSAWSAPEPVIIKLAELYPEVHMVHHYIDEGYGFGCTDIYDEGLLISQWSASNIEEFGKEEFGHVPYEEEEEDD